MCLSPRTLLLEPCFSLGSRRLGWDSEDERGRRKWVPAQGMWYVSAEGFAERWLGLKC